MQQTGYGDHIATIEIIAPTELTDHQKELMIAFGAEEEFSGWANGVTPGVKSKFAKTAEKVKEFFTDDKEASEFGKSKFEYEDDWVDRKKYDKKSRRFHDEESVKKMNSEVESEEEEDKSKTEAAENTNSASENQNQYRQERIQKDTEKVTEKLNQPYEEPEYEKRRKSLDALKEEDKKKQKEREVKEQSESLFKKIASKFKSS